MPSRFDELQIKAARLKELEDKALTLSQQTLPPQAEDKPLAPIGERIAEDYETRISNVRQSMAQNIGGGPFSPGSSPTPLATTALDVVGNVAGFGLDILGEGVRSIIDQAAEIFPEASEKVSEAITELMQTDAGRAVLSGAESAQEGWQFVKKHRPHQAKEIEDIANVFLLGARPSKDTLGRRITKSVQAGEVAKKKAYLETMVLNDNAKAGRLALAKVTKDTGRHKAVLDLNKFDQSIIDEVSKIKGVSPKNSPAKTSNLIQAANNETVAQLDDLLKGSSARISKDGMNNILDATLERSVRSHILLDEPARKALRDLAEGAKQAIAMNPNTPKGIWEARKMFDQFAKDAKTTVFKGDRPTDAFSSVVDNLRSTMNGVIKEAEPQAKTLLEKSHRLFKAQEHILPKVDVWRRTEAPTMVRDAMQRAYSLVAEGGRFKRIGALSAGGIATGASYYAGLPLLGALGLGAGVGVGVLAAKAAAHPMSRQFLGEVLNFTEKAILGGTKSREVIKSLRADRAALIELIESLPEEETQ